MAVVNPKDAQEVNDGLILNEGAAGLFSGSGNPSGAAPNGSIYIDTDNGKTWRYISGAWIQSFGGALARNSVSIFSSDVNGQNVTTGSYTGIAFKPIAGSDQYSGSATFTWGVVGKSSNGGTMDVRIIVKSSGVELGALNWDNETDPTFKSLDITSPNGVNILQVEAKRTNGTAIIYSSGIEVVYG